MAVVTFNRVFEGFAPIVQEVYIDAPEADDVYPLSVLFAKIEPRSSTGEPLVLSNLSVSLLDTVPFRVIDVLPSTNGSWFVRAFGGAPLTGYPARLDAPGFAPVFVSFVVRRPVVGPVLRVFNLAGIVDSEVYDLAGRTGGESFVLRGGEVLS
jgi:hypothetical protein